MRITAVTTAVPSSRKPRLLGFIRALRLAGHEVSVLATADLSLGGGEGATQSGLELLERWGVPVTRVPFKPSPGHLARASTSVALRRACSETALYDSSALATRLASAVDATRPEVVHVDRVRALALVRNLAIPIVVDVTDPRFATYRLYRQGGLPGRFGFGLTETFRAWLDQRPAAVEETAGLRGIPILVASGIGARALAEAGVTSSLIWDVPSAVFTEERVEPLAQTASPRPVIGMSGNLSYPPNVLGFRDLAKDILPAIRSEMDVQAVMIGASPHRLVERWAKRGDIKIHRDVASVPDTIRQLQVSVMLSPQSVSAGFPNRVIDAVYRAGVPIVASPQTIWGAPPALAEKIPVADAPAEWPHQIRGLLTGDGRRDLVVELQNRIDRVCGAEVVADSLTSAYNCAMAHSRPGTARY